MSGFYCIQPRVWRGRRLHEDTSGGCVDPYALSMPDHRQRNRQTSTRLPSGLVRIDLGEPLKRLPSESQSVTVTAPEEPEVAPGEAETVAVSDFVTPSILSVVHRDDWRADYGLRKSR